MEVSASPSTLETELAQRLADVISSDGQPPAVGTRAEIGASTVVVVTRHLLSDDEKALAQRGGARGVNELRDELRLSIECQLTNVVEQALGVDVLAFLTASHVEPSITVDTFVLGLPPDTRASR